MADLVLIESTIATRGETTTSDSNKCCTKSRAVALNCTVTAPSNAADNQLITGAKGNLRHLAVSMTGFTYGGAATSPYVTGNTGGGAVTYTYKAFGAGSYSSTKPVIAGTHTVKASVAATTNYIAKEVTSTYTVAKASRSGAVSCSNVTFGSTVTATVSGNTESGTITWGITAGTGTATISSAGKVTPTKVGTVTVTASVAATANYKAYTATSKQITISKRTVNVVAPTKTDRAYTGSAQTIFAAGSCTAGGTMYYSDTDKTFSPSTWSTSLPYTQQTAPGRYTIYYYCYVADTTNNTGAKINTKFSISASIGKNATTAPTLTAGGTTTYTGTTYYAKAASASSNPAGKIYYGASSGATTYNITASTTATNLSSMGRKDVGTTTIYAFFRPTDTTNYSDSSVVSTTVTITNKATGSSGSVSNPAAQTYKASGTYSYQLGISGATGTVTYPTSITVKNGSTTISGWTCTSAGVVTVPQGTNAASYTVTGSITVAASTNYKAVSATSKTWTITINKATGSASISGRTLTYSDGVAYDLISVSNNTGTMHYRLGTDGSWKDFKPATNVPGTYTVYYYMDASTNYTARGSSSSPWGSVSTTINKADPTYTAPTEKEGLMYNNTNLVLLNPGSSSHGTFYYRKGSDGPFSTSIPTVNDAGTYVTQWYLQGDSNHNSTSPATIYVRIEKAPGYINIQGNNLRYTGSAQELVTLTKSSGTVHYRLGTSGNWTKIIPKATNIGTYTVYYYVDWTTHYESVGSTSNPGSVTAHIS